MKNGTQRGFICKGFIIYEMISGKQLFQNIGQDNEEMDKIRSLLTKGDFSDDIWTLPMSPRIVACWCPSFAKEMLEKIGCLADF